VAELIYTPHGRRGFAVSLTTTRANSITTIVTPEAIEPPVSGSPKLLDNESLCANLLAYGTHEESARRLRATDKRKSHRAQAERHANHATAIAEMIEHVDGSVRDGWCSGCFAKNVHRKVDGPASMRATYLCGQCGAPSTPCAVPACRNMANRGIRAVTTPRYCAEHRHDIASFVRMTDRLAVLDDYAEWLRFDRHNAARATKIVAAVGVVGVCVVPAAWAAAPAVGGAIGSMTGLSGAAATSHGLALLGGGSLAAGGYGMAGGALVATAAGSGLGGVMGGIAAAAYVKADSSFRIECLRGGTGTPVVVANGFLTQGTTGWADWNALIDARYPLAPVYRVHWGAKELKALGVLLAVGGGKQAARAVLANFARQASKKVGMLAGLAGLLLAGDLAANPWTVARTRADMTGAVLADLIARTDHDRFILIGHSLGARVMVKAGQLLGTRPDAPKVEAMHLLGAAVGSKGDWRTLDAAVVQKVWNYHSRNDKVLSQVYRSAQLGETAVGCRGFKSSFPKIVDRDVSRRVAGHSGYFNAVTLAS
jgi:hypothetical protein